MWFRGEITNIPPATTFLFCDSTFLVLRDLTAPAQDQAGSNIKKDGADVPISVAYKNKVTKGALPWWAGDRTTANGYYFEEINSGGNYCSQPGNEGLTSNLELFGPGPGDTFRRKVQHNNVVLCPGSFNNGKPDSWTIGSGRIGVGTSLDTVLPKCTTLLHETFHLIFGSNFVEGNNEHRQLPQSY